MDILGGVVLAGKVQPVDRIESGACNAIAKLCAGTAVFIPDRANCFFAVNFVMKNRCLEKIVAVVERHFVTINS